VCTTGNSSEFSGHYSKFSGPAWEGEEGSWFWCLTGNSLASVVPHIKISRAPSQAEERGPQGDNGEIIGDINHILM
jgi:hypothetical protein